MPLRLARPKKGKAAGPPRIRPWDPSTSPLTRRILLLNLLAPLVLVAGLLYLDRYKQALIRSELDSLQAQAQMFAVALGEGAVSEGPLSFPELNRDIATQMLKRLVEPAGVRARLYNYEGRLVIDSRFFSGTLALVKVEDLPPSTSSSLETALHGFYDFMSLLLQSDHDLPLYSESAHPSANDYPETMWALAGETRVAARTTPRNDLILYAAVPIQRYKQVTGAILLSDNGKAVARGLFEVRLTILQVFALSLLVTVLLSLYLAATIARPVHRLALAAERVRRGQVRHHTIPDLSSRKDEIGELSAALRDMTEALWQRMDAIEAFAADVAHEIKNPLTSLRSAVETIMLLKDQTQRDKLMGIVLDDINRLNRLISDISDASRLDAELSRAEAEKLSIRDMLRTLAEIYQATEQKNDVRLVLTLADEEDALEVTGLEGRLVQVIRNLISNAVSFSPPGASILLRGERAENGSVRIEVEDEGPGIPENKLEAVFERFYSERPRAEKFGTHSGLGLSISKQIIETHHGTIRAGNRRISVTEGEGRSDDPVCGARFTVTLPAAPSMTGKKG